jgi:hypothetical protein
MARSACVFSRHEPNALDAASMAARVSAPLASGTVPITACVAGSFTSTVAPEAASRHAPAIRHCCRNSPLSFNASIRPPFI